DPTHRFFVRKAPVLGVSFSIVFLAIPFKRPAVAAVARHPKIAAISVGLGVPTTTTGDSAD
ncbi:MAG: hypothetical protein ACK48K_01535, partial [Planctomycetota bacterium]